MSDLSTIVELGPEAMEVIAGGGNIEFGDDSDLTDVNVSNLEGDNSSITITDGDTSPEALA